MSINPAGRRYWDYWGKAEDESTPDFHRLIYHSLDVAAMGKVLLRVYSGLHQNAAATLQIAESQFEGLWLFALAVHDLGKLAGGFQMLNPAIGSRLGHVEPLLYDVRHDTLGYWLWADPSLKVTRQLVTVPTDRNPERRGKNFTRRLLATTMGHHGQPPKPRTTQAVRHYFSSDNVAAAQDFVADCGFLLPLPVSLSWDETNFQELSWFLAGLATFSDWLGSDRKYFDYQTEPLLLEEYFELAVRKAEAAAADIGLTRPLPKKRISTKKLLHADHEPRPLQKAAQSLVYGSGPQMVLIEDLTGSGKTEAALTIAQNMIADGIADGVYFALPTMATANAMQSRVEALAATLFDRSEFSTLVHSKSGLARALAAKFLPGESETPVDGIFGEASGLRREWFDDNRKRALLSTLGVGTIDQALLAALHTRHNCLRLLGLYRKVLIIDELHSFDEYTLKLLEKLLLRHFAAGGSAIVMTATLALKDCANILRLMTPVPVADTSFPRLVHVDPSGVKITRSYQPNPRSIFTRLVHDESALLEQLIAAAQQGKAVCWIRNTVDLAIGTWEQAQARLGEKALLCHARFTIDDRMRNESELMRRFGPQSGARDRTGYLLIATQVVEQSMDLDFDMLATDLCPIDLLLQRDGRRMRHARDDQGNRVAEGPDLRVQSPLLVLSPEFDRDPAANWFKSFSPMSAPIYSLAQLWLTCRWLTENSRWDLPQGSRRCIEAVYGESECPVAIQKSLDEAEGERLGQRAFADMSSLQASGYDADNPFPGDVCAKTRDGLESVTCRLARLVDGSLQPWNDDANTWLAWQLSEVSLADYVVEKRNYANADLEKLASSLEQGWRGRFPVIVPEMTFVKKGPVHYDRERGLHIAPAGAGKS